MVGVKGRAPISCLLRPESPRSAPALHSPCNVTTSNSVFFGVGSPCDVLQSIYCLTLLATDQALIPDTLPRPHTQP